MTNQTTVVGAQTRISGNIHGEQDLRVSGRIDGTLELSGTLFVEPEGVVVADVNADRALISGTVVGNITASDVIEIAEAGRVVGDLVAPRVIIADGAAFRGGIDMGDLDAPRAAAPSVARATRPADHGETQPVVTPRATEPARPRPQPPRPQPKVKPAPAARPAPRPAPAPAPPPPVETAPAKRRPKPPTTAGKKSRARRK